ALWKLGPTADMEEASLWQMPAAAAHGVRLVGLQPGELVVVTGQGLIGQMSAQMSRLRGATVISSDLMEKRVQLSALYSADIAIDGRSDNLLEIIHQVQPDVADVVSDNSVNSRFID